VAARQPPAATEEAGDDEELLPSRLGAPGQGWRCEGPPADEEGQDERARVPALLADLVEPAKTTAREKLGAGERAIRIASGLVGVVACLR